MIKCNSCGAEIPKHEIFCPKCNQPVRHIGNKYTRLAAALIMLVILAVAFLTIANNIKNSAGDYLQAGSSITLFYDEALNESHIVVDGIVQTVIIPGNAEISNQSSQKDECVIRGAANDGLWYYNDGTVTLLTDKDVIFCVADNKLNTIAYRTRDGDLFAYRPSNGETFELSHNCSTVAISPDGETIAFRENDMGLYISGAMDGKDDIFVANASAIVAVSNSADFLYYTSSSELFVYSGKTQNTKSLAENYFSSNSNMINSELIFFANGQVYYQKAAESPRPLGISTYSFKVVSSHTAWRFAGSFLNSVFLDSDNATLYYLSKNATLYTVSDNVSDAHMSSDEKFVYFSKNGAIYTVTTGGDVEEKLAAENVISYAVMKNSSNLYYLGSDKNLYSIKGDKRTLIATGCAGIYLTHEDVLLYRDDNAGLFEVGKDSIPKLITNDLYEVMVLPYATYYLSGNNADLHDVYTATSGGDFDLILRNISR